MNPPHRYLPDTDQLSLVSTFSDALEQLLPMSRLHESFTEHESTWSEFESLGLFSIGASEAQGGSGLGAVEEALIAAELGQRLVSPSILATIASTHALADDVPGAPPRTAAGYVREDHIVLIEEPAADRVLVRKGADTALYAITGRQTPLDPGLWHTPLTVLHPDQPPLAGFDEAGLQRLRLIDAAALSGIAQSAVDMAVAYAEVRKQFGRAIGSFQAIKHHCANMAIAARKARDQLAFAAVAVDDGRKDADLQVDCALLTAAKGALDNAGLNIQVHGGMGFSAEADPHLLVKRSQVLIALAGGMESIRERVAQAPTPG